MICTVSSSYRRPRFDDRVYTGRYAPPASLADCIEAIRLSNGYVSRAAHILGITRRGFTKRLWRLNLWPYLDQVRIDETKRRERLLGPQ